MFHLASTFSPISYGFGSDSADLADSPVLRTPLTATGDRCLKSGARQPVASTNDTFGGGCWIMLHLATPKNIRCPLLVETLRGAPDSASCGVTHAAESPSISLSPPPRSRRTCPCLAAALLPRPARSSRSNKRGGFLNHPLYVH